MRIQWKVLAKVLSKFCQSFVKVLLEKTDRPSCLYIYNTPRKKILLSSNFLNRELQNLIKNFY